MAIHRNQLIARLSRQDRQQLLAVGRLEELTPGTVLCEATGGPAAVYFPTSGTASVIAEAVGTAGLGLALVGREGMLGMHLLLGSSTSSLRVVVQTCGRAVRLDAEELAGMLHRRMTLRLSLLAYVPVFLEQLAATVVCARFHAVEARVARWLLMGHVRGEGIPLHITHESLASLLGVRRVSVTVAAHELRRRRLIDYHRGEVVVLDPIGLEAAACECCTAHRARDKKIEWVDDGCAQPR